MIILWGRANSSNVKKVIWCLEELRVPYSRIDAGGSYGGLQQPEYLVLNPNGVIPTIDDEGFILWESNAIIRYLANQYQGEHLYSQEPKQRALTDQWLDWTTSTLFEMHKALLIALLRTPAAQQDQQHITQLLRKTAELYGIVNQALAKQPWLSGSGFGLADIAMSCFAYAWFNLPIERVELTHLQNWYSQVAERALFKKVVALPLS